MEKTNEIYINLENGLELHADIEGAGEPILCLSGLGCSNYNFDFLKESLKDHFELILLDNRGTGKSSKTQDNYTIDDLCDDAFAVMERLGHKRFSVIGISMGGFIAQKMAIKKPDVISKLVLLCTTSGGDNFKPLPMLDDEAITSFFSLDEDKRTLSSLNAITHPNFQLKNAELFTKLLEIKKKNTTTRNEFIRQNRAAIDFLKKDLNLNKIDNPTLIMTGADDRFVDPYNSLVLSSQIGSSKLVKVNESDHLFFMEKAPEVSRHIETFLSNPIGV